MIIVTLTKLLVINIVAKVRSLSLRNIWIFLSFDVLHASISEISDGERLKNAISEPLANPDNNRSMTARTMENSTPKVSGIN